MHVLLSVCLGWLLTLGVFPPARAVLLRAQEPARTSQPVALKPGDPAPPFDLEGSDGKRYRLSEFLGVRPVVIAWFPRAYATL